MKQKSTQLNIPTAVKKYDATLFENIEYAHDAYEPHKVIAKKLKKCSPYTITIIIDSLEPELYKNSEFAQRIKTPRDSLYKELLYTYFFEEFDQRKGHDVYAQWLDEYRPKWQKEQQQRYLDDYIIENELEPRYLKKIQQKHKDTEKIKRPRFHISYERYYRLPEPLNHIDWRNPYDNIFVWADGKKKLYARGGSGGSSQREINTKYIYGFSLINKTQPVPSYLFVYTKRNELRFVKRFSTLTVPQYDIGHNYHIPHKEHDNILKSTNFLSWDSFIEATTITVE